jgi:hypothetical protein
MNSSLHPTQTDPTLSRSAFFKIRRAELPGASLSARLPGAGSGSLGEFIKKRFSEPLVATSAISEKI